MGLKLITIANVIVIQYLVTSHYEVPHKWAWLVATALILTPLLVLRKGPPVK